MRFYPQISFSDIDLQLLQRLIFYPTLYLHTPKSHSRKLTYNLCAAELDSTPHPDLFVTTRPTLYLHTPPFTYIPTYIHTYTSEILINASSCTCPHARARNPPFSLGTTYEQCQQSLGRPLSWSRPCRLPLRWICVCVCVCVCVYNYLHT